MKTPTVITQRLVMDSLRIPLPAQTGGIHRDKRYKTRQTKKVSMKKGDWE